MRRLPDIFRGRRISAKRFIMDNKTKDCVFSVLLLLVGGFVVFEGLRMVGLAARPPLRIDLFRISPGMLPTVLGGGLIFFALLLLAGALRGETAPASSLVRHLRASSVRVGRALGDIDVKSMMASVGIMAVYTFLLVGRVPFWLGAALFLVGLMLYLRAARLWVVLLISAASIFALIMLFEKMFNTTLP
jgi:hypothetical protein